MSTALSAGVVAGAAELEQRIRALANEIVDPCSAATTFQVGLVDMGMLLGVEQAPAAGERDGGSVAVRLRLRTTGPGCLYVVYFERELRARIEALPEVATLELAWDDAFDWSPDDLAPHVQAELAARRRRLIATIPGGRRSA